MVSEKNIPKGMKACHIGNFLTKKPGLKAQANLFFFIIFPNLLVAKAVLIPAM
jgi:hypothetical protein